MLTAFKSSPSGLVRLPEITDSGSLQPAVWIDLAEPTDGERLLVETLHESQLPDTEDLEEIEASSRSYADEAGLHMSAMFLHRTGGREEIANAALRLGKDRLVTLHEPEIPALRLLRMRADRGRTGATPMELLGELFEIKLDHLADTLEEIQEALDDIAETALQQPGGDLRRTIDTLALLEHRNSKVRLCLTDAQRDLTFLVRHGELDKPMRRNMAALLRDANSLLPHCTFLFEKVGFLLQTLHGAINIQQNQTIKLFSVVAVIFLPPTLIASIYGMNFRFMPELDWPWGYPLAIVLMVLSAIAPYVFFKRKGWL